MKKKKAEFTLKEDNNKSPWTYHGFTMEQKMIKNFEALLYDINYILMPRSKNVSSINLAL